MLSLLKRELGRGTTKKRRMYSSRVCVCNNRHVCVCSGIQWSPSFSSQFVQHGLHFIHLVLNELYNALLLLAQPAYLTLQNGESLSANGLVDVSVVAAVIAAVIVAQSFLLLLLLIVRRTEPVALLIDAHSCTL